MKLLTLVVAMGIVIVGCTQDRDKTPEQPVATGRAVVEPVSPAPTKNGTDTAVNAIRREAVDIELVGGPGYSVEEDQLVFDVEVTNSGDGPFDPADAHPLNLGVTLAGPDGVDQPPGRRAFKRARLPLIAAGEGARVTVRAPASELLNLEVQVEPVQEGVMWFGAAYGGPILKIGMFRRCQAREATLCAGDGTPLPLR